MTPSQRRHVIKIKIIININYKIQEAMDSS